MRFLSDGAQFVCCWVGFLNDCMDLKISKYCSLRVLVNPLIQGNTHLTSLVHVLKLDLLGLAALSLELPNNVRTFEGHFRVAR